MSWLLRTLKNITKETLCFFGRLARDMFLGMWKPVRKRIIKWAPLAIFVGFIAFLYHMNPTEVERMIQPLLVIGIMLCGIKIIISKSFKIGKK